MKKPLPIPPAYPPSRASTITSTGAPHTRGFLVRTADGRIGRTYHRECYIRTHINVYVEITPGEYQEGAIPYTRDQLTIISYIE